MPIHRDTTNAAWGYLPFNGGPRTCLGRKLLLAGPHPHREPVGTYTDFSLPFLSAEDFALTEAAYTVVRLLHRFPIMQLPAGQKVEILGVEKQTLTLVLSSTEGCVVDFKSGEARG